MTAATGLAVAVADKMSSGVSTISAAEVARMVIATGRRKYPVNARQFTTTWAIMAAAITQPSHSCAIRVNPGDRWKNSMIPVIVTITVDPMVRGVAQARNVMVMSCVTLTLL